MYVCMYVCMYVHFVCIQPIALLIIPESRDPQLYVPPKDVFLAHKGVFIALLVARVGGCHQYIKPLRLYQ